jgi:hypothetical protein
MQLGSIPVYIYHNKPFLPFENEINWKEIAILINSSDIENIDDILKNVSDERYEYMLSKIKQIYPKYFTLNGMCNQIIEFLQKQ